MYVKTRRTLLFLVCVTLLAGACESKLEPTKIMRGEIAPPSDQTLLYWRLEDEVSGSILLRQHDGHTFELSRGGGPSGPFDFYPDWSWDKKWIAYVRGVFQFPMGQVWIMGYNGNGKVALTPRDVYCMFPSFSPDGGKVACAALVDPQEFIRHLVLINADGSGWQQITDNSTLSGFEKISFDEASWAPDGLRLIVEYATLRAGQVRFSVGILEIGTGNFQTFPGLDHLSPGQPNWSPTGDRILLVAQQAGGRMDIFSINADGTNLRWMTSDGLSFEPDWSNDGKQIVFARLDPQTQTSSIWVMNADGSGQKLLVPASAKVSLRRPRW